MNRMSVGKYTAFVVGLIALFGGIGLATSGIYLTQHEGDAAHMVEILLRMLQGQVPHLDFSTPIGILAFLPILLLSKSGMGLGQAFLAAQVLIAVILAPMVVRVAVSRLHGLAGWAFGAVVMALVLAVIHGEGDVAISVSMYYNRWAWAASFVLILLAVLPPAEGREAPRLDGLIAGLLLAALALIKPTYFVSFLLPVVIGFLLRGARRSLVTGIVTGVAVALVVVVAYGVDFFPAYINDLLSVTRSETRAAPGMSLIEVVNAPRFLIASLTLILSIIVLRQAGEERAGVLLLLLAPGFIYVTYQNFGNDPIWLILLCLLLMAQRPIRGRRVVFNADARNAISALSLVAFALIAPSLQNIVTSPFRLYSTEKQDFVRQFPMRAEVPDIYVNPERSNMLTGQEVLVDRFPELAPYVTESARFEPVSFLGERLPRCVLHGGELALHSYMADRLKEEPFNFAPDSAFFVADVASELWILGGFSPLEGGAPWYYSGTPGIEHADAIVVPTCPLDPSVRRHALAAIETAGLTLRPPLRDPMMLVYPIVRD